MATTVYTYNDKVLKNVATDKWLKKVEASPLPPIPAYTIRAKILTGQEPSSSGPPMTFALVDAAQNIWDITSQQYFAYIAGYGLSYAIEVLDWNPGDLTTTSSGSGFGGAGTNQYLTKVTLTNFGNLTNINYLFKNNNHNLDALEEINLSGTQNITSFQGFCSNLPGLKRVPLFDTSSATNVANMFAGCTNVESGALAMYNQLAALGSQITTNTDTFAYCGSNTVTGAAELAQIPASWGGTGA